MSASPVSTVAARLPLELRVVASAEAPGRRAADATRLLAAGDREGAAHVFREAQATAPRLAASWINLAALAAGLGDPASARAHAQRAVTMDRRNPDAWVNLGAASWHAGLRRDAAQAMAHALALAPGMEPAALNLALMFRAVQQPVQAREVLDTALGHQPRSRRLHHAQAELCRLLGDGEATRRHALHALRASANSMVQAAGPDGPEPEDPVAQERLRATMADACDRLAAAGIAHHLVGGVVLGIARQGRPFAGDKDVDFGLDFAADRAGVAEIFSEGYTRIQVPDPDAALRWCLGLRHDATGVGVDLFFKQPVGDALRICLGWPDALQFDLPRYGVADYHWDGRDWPFPAPLEAYLAADYGPDWRTGWREFQGHVFDKRWWDSQLSSPSLAEETRPRAVNLGLLRLLAALQEQRWAKALALCDQLQALEPLQAVGELRARLLATDPATSAAPGVRW